MAKVIIVDLDGTVANCDHRVHHAIDKDWDLFHGAMISDTPHKHIVALLEALDMMGYDLLVVTGRPEKYRKTTMAWLEANGIDKLFMNILMRPNDDYSSDFLLKLELLERYFGSIEAAKEAILFALDDRDQVAEAFRNAGIPCLQVAQGDF